MYPAPAEYSNFLPMKNTSTIYKYDILHWGKKQTKATTANWVLFEKNCIALSMAVVTTTSVFSLKMHKKCLSTGLHPDPQGELIACTSSDRLLDLRWLLCSREEIAANEQKGRGERSSTTNSWICYWSSLWEKLVLRRNYTARSLPGWVGGNQLVWYKFGGLLSNAFAVNMAQLCTAGIDQHLS